VGLENPVHLLFIAAVALIVLGPKRLPALARAVGQAVREFRASLEEGAQPRPEAGAEQAQTLAAPEQTPAAPSAAGDSAPPHGADSPGAGADPAATPGAGA
jgi:TatA/E family protein of Tat protein translocase